MKLGFIGAGKVAAAMGVYFHKHGYPVIGYMDRLPEMASMCAVQVKGQVYPSMEALLQEADILFIATGDSGIEAAANALAEEVEAAAGKTVVHFSGALTSDELGSLRKKGASVASFHPLQAFAAQGASLEQLPNTVFSVEGDDQAVTLLEGILERTGNRYFRIDAKQKTLYHMTACLVSNYLVTLVDAGLNTFEAIGIDRELGYAALYPLISGTVENLRYLDTKDALTGPIARGDALTIEKHLSALKDPAVETLYRTLGAYTVDMAEHKKIGADQAKALHALLDK